MTESLSGQFDGMLPGVDWNQYHKEQLPGELGPEKSAERERIRRYRQDFPNASRKAIYLDSDQMKQQARAEADVPLEGLHSARTFYTPEKEAEASASLQKIHRVARKRSAPGMTVPEGIHSNHFIEHDPLTGERKYLLTLHDPMSKSSSYSGDEVAKVQWNGNSGHVRWMGVEKGYEHLVPHLVSRAHHMADMNGDTGPTQSNELTSYSHKLMKKHVPSFLDRENTLVDYEDLPPEARR